MTIKMVLPQSDPFFAEKPFDCDGRLFTTIPEFAAYINQPEVTLIMRSWAKRVTVHHTYIPTVAQWKEHGGYASLKGMIREWRDVRGWSVGPNMCIAPEGIYLITGLDNPGIHAGVCNDDGIGCEVVGNYDAEYWVEPIRSYVFGAFTYLSLALGNSPTDVINKHLVNGHRECLSNKSCPGDAIDLNRFRKDVAASMVSVISQMDASVIGVPPSVTLVQFKAYLAKYGAPVPANELERIYMMCAWLEIDPAFLAAAWKQEAFADDPTDARVGVAVIGGSVLQRQSHNPLNLLEDGKLRPSVDYDDKTWRKWSSWQLGLMDAILYLKEVHGAAGRLTVRDIVNAHAPASEGKAPDTFIANVLTRMNEMRSL